MPTDIRMYNCAFGDCFRITQSDAPNSPEKVLFVDFGIHRLCEKDPIGWKSQRYQDIVRDILNTYPLNTPHENVDFLLSHYHADHYSGLDHLPNNWKFNNVYIPDVWNDEIDIRVIDLLLLRDIYTTATLGSNRSLISFLIKICHVTGRIYFVQRGRKIQDNNYIALAPFVDLINQEAARVFQQIGIGSKKEVFLIIDDIATKLRRVVQNIEKTAVEEERQQLIPQLENLESQLEALVPMINAESTVQQSLSKFANRINIIFHNQAQRNRNILFTGDAEGDNEGSTRYGKEEWQLIEENADGIENLHEHYHVIKIPHHGTKPHYHDFTAKSTNETIYLIPNGRKETWPIDERYSNNANVCNCAVYCSSNRPCNAANHGCTCNNRHIVPEHHDPYQDI